MDLPKIFKISLAVVVSIFALLFAIGFYQLWSMSHKSYAFDDHDLARHLIGRWDWKARAHPCGDSSEVIAFADDRKTMTISMAPHMADTGWTATYDLLELKPTRLRGAIRGEKRLTDDGKPVIWDLVMFGPNEYRWQRTDWDEWNYTPGIIRCGPAGPDTTHTS